MICKLQLVAEAGKTIRFDVCPQVAWWCKMTHQPGGSDEPLEPPLDPPLICDGRRWEGHKKNLAYLACWLPPQVPVFSAVFKRALSSALPVTAGDPPWPSDYDACLPSLSLLIRCSADPEAGWHGRYITVQRCEGLSMDLLHLKDPLQLFV